MKLNMVNLFKRMGSYSFFTKTKVSDLYEISEISDLKMGLRAEINYKRIADTLEVEFETDISDIVQWTEERSPNHHQNVRNTKWPVGLIIVSGIDPIKTARAVSKTQRILDYQPLREFELEIVLAANSSGGIKPKTVEDYDFSVYLSNKNPIRNYWDFENLIKKNFGDDLNFQFVGRMPIDFVRLKGMDNISGGRVYIDIGNRPEIVKYPRNKFGLKKKGLTFIPRNSVSIL